MLTSRLSLVGSTALCALSLGCGGLSDDGKGSSSTSAGSSSTTSSSGAAGSSVASTVATGTGATSTTDATSGSGSSGVGGAGGSGASATTAATGSGGSGSGGAGSSGAGGQSSGGSGGTSSVPDAGAPDARSDAARGDAGGPSAGCVGVTTKFCDDFEQQTLGQTPTGAFTVSNRPGLIVDSTKPFSGTKSVHITAARPAPSTMMQFTQQFPTNDYHGRVMLFVVRTPTNIHWDHVFSYSQNNVQWEIGGMFGKFMFTVDPPDHALTSIAFPTNKWFCLQWEFKYGGTATADHTFLAKMDGAVLDKGQFTGPDPGGTRWQAGPWRSLNVGWVGYGAPSDVDIEMWVDDLAFGDQPIACPAMTN